jgi:hypothetical protein
VTSLTAGRREAATGKQAWLDRLLAAVPLLTIFIWFCLIYAWQAWVLVTPFIFTDELELTQLARSIAETGEPARRGEANWSGSIAAWLMAPAWLIDDAQSAYDTAKFIGVVVMTAAAFPAYGLARMVVSRWPALFAAVATIAIPAFMYSALLLEEPYAYFVSTLALYLIARALVKRTPAAVVAALAVCAIAPFVRVQLAVLPVVFAFAALGLAWRSAPARRWRRSWSTWDWVGTVALTVGLLVVLNEALSHLSFSWLVATRHYKERMLEYGLWAGGAFAIGLGILPVLAGLASLARPRGEESSPARRAFVAVFVSALVAFGFYTAVKAAYLSTVFATRVAERNLVYLAPLFFVATAIWLERPRLRVAALAAATAATGVLLAVTPIQLDYPYFEAPGFSILAEANRDFELPQRTLETLLLVALGVSALLLLVPRLLARRPAGLTAFTTGVALLVLAWNITGQQAASAGSRSNADQFLASFPDPPDWLDQTTNGRSTLFLGQRVYDANGIWMLEFWNRSLRYVWSLDGTAPGPGRTNTPNVASVKGDLQQQLGDIGYVLADTGIEVAGSVAARQGSWTLYETEYPVRLSKSVEGIYADGWMGEHASYTQYSTRLGKPGFAVLTVSRRGWGGTNVPGRVRVTAGDLVLGAGLDPHIRKVSATRSCTIESQKTCAFVLPVPAPPFRVEVAITPTFVPADLDPRSSDRRELGAVVGFGFSEQRPSRLVSP